MTEAQRAINDWQALEGGSYKASYECNEYSQQCEVLVESIDCRRARIAIKPKFGERDAGYYAVTQALDEARKTLERTKWEEREKAMVNIGMGTPLTINQTAQTGVAFQMKHERAMAAAAARQKELMLGEMKKLRNEVYTKNIASALQTPKPATTIASAQETGNLYWGRQVPQNSSFLGGLSSYSTGAINSAMLGRERTPLVALRDEIEEWCGKALECA